MDAKKITKKITFIGAGNMAEALARGLIRSDAADAANMTASDPDPGRCAYFENNLNVKTLNDNNEAAKRAEVLVLAVKPQTLPEVISGLLPESMADRLIISIVAGVTLAHLVELTGNRARLVRAMPNMPAFAGAGATVFSRGELATRDDMELARHLFAASGLAMELDEIHLNAVTALSGSGPAYVFYLTEAMARAGVELGLPESAAVELAVATVAGAGALLRETGTSPAELRTRVTSRGGTTAAAVSVFDERGLRDIVSKAMAAASRRAEELAR